jgi:hypothetical protein
MAMTAEDEKLILVMNKVYAGTKADALDWQPSEDPNIFAAKLTDYTLSLERAPETEKTPEGFNFSIVNSDGLVLQELDSHLATKHGFAEMKDLFDRARRHAVDIDGALDDLIRELDELSSERS